MQTHGHTPGSLFSMLATAREAEQPSPGKGSGGWLAACVAFVLAATGAIAALCLDAFGIRQPADLFLAALAGGLAASAVLGPVIARLRTALHERAAMPAGEPPASPGRNEQDIPADSLWLVRDLRGRVIEANALFAAAAGKDQASIAGLEFQDVIQPLIDHGTTASDGHFAVRTPAGTRWYSWHEKIVARSGTGERMIEVTGRDVTAQKLAEQDLKTSSERARHANEAKSRFLRTVSHEMRTPLNGILGMGSLMNQTVMTPEQHSYVRAIETSGRALLLLIEDLLDFAKIEAGRIDLNPEAVELAPAIEGLVEFLAPRAGSKGLELAAWIDPALPASVMTDMPRLRQVLINLAGNGIKFTHSGGVMIEVRREPAAGETGRIAASFSVRDTGIGISAADADRIFQEFEQVDLGAARSYEGTGLGLAIARRLVRMMGGDIVLSSTPDEGSCFSFTLSLAVADSGAASAPLPPASLTEPAGPATTAPGGQAAPALQSQWAAIAVAFAGETKPLPLARPEPVLSATALPAVAAGQPFAGRRILMISDSRIEAPLLLRQLFGWGADATLAAPSETEASVLACLGGGGLDAVIVDAGCCDPEHLADRIAAVANVPLAVAVAPAQRDRLGPWMAYGYKAFLIKPVRTATLRGVVSYLLGESQFAPVEPVTPASVLPKCDTALAVLVCDDNEINLLLAKALLEKLGHRATTVHDGFHAADTAATGDPVTGTGFDAVLMDLHMPEMDGFETAARMRESLAAGGRPMPPMIALTADAMPETRARCLAEGFAACITKPIDAFALGRLLQGIAGTDGIDRAGDPAEPQPHTA